jgi:trans-2-enoyl-CoA reductase
MVGVSAIQLAAAKGVKSINIIRKTYNSNLWTLFMYCRRPDYAELVEKLKAYGAYMVVGDDYIRTREFRQLIADLPKPKLALNCVGGDTATEMARLLGYVVIVISYSLLCSEGGVMVTYGGMSLKPVTVPTGPFIFNDITLKGFWMSKWYAQHSGAEKKALFDQLSQLVSTKKLRLWTERHSLSAITDAIARAEDTSSRDRKVLLKLSE